MGHRNQLSPPAAGVHLGQFDKGIVSLFNQEPQHAGAQLCTDVSMFGFFCCDWDCSSLAASGPPTLMSRGNSLREATLESIDIGAFSHWPWCAKTEKPLAL
jgi:hypothetical protein